MNSPHWAAFRDDELFIANPGLGNTLRFTFDAAGNAMSNGEITPTVHVRGVQVNPATGELFLTICCGVNEIRRYLFDATGNAVPNGSITGGGINSPHGLAFSPWGELFVVNGSGNSVSRFVFDAAGNASPNGLITGSLSIPLGIDFSPWGEMFVANRNNAQIHRWVFDASFNAIPNGSFQHTQRIHDLKFLTPEALIAGLIQNLDSLVLPPGASNALINPLETAAALLGDGNPNNDNAACAALNAFIHQVENLSGQPHGIPPADAPALIEAAEAIKAAAGCS